MSRAADDDLVVFESHRGHLIALAYRMLGDVARAEDVVQETWVRWGGRDTDAVTPRAYLVTITTRLCLNELDSARARLEETRADRLPEPVSLDDGPFAHVDALEQISMAFLVVLQRLTPRERAVLLLHDVFDFGHAEVAALVGGTEASCRKLLERARDAVATEKRLLATSRETHARLLDAFMRAASGGDVSALARLLAEDAVLVTDGGAEGIRSNGLRNLDRPLRGAQRVAAFVVAATARGAGSLTSEVRELNGQAAMVLYAADEPFAAILLGVAGDRVHRVYFHADRARVRHLGRRKLPR